MKKESIMTKNISGLQKFLTAQYRHEKTIEIQSRNRNAFSWMIVPKFADISRISLLKDIADLF